MSSIGVLLLLSASAGGPDDSVSSPQIEVSSVVVTLIEEVEVPATKAGILSKVAVREGRLVEKGDRLARIDDTMARLALKRAEAELEIARQKAAGDISVRYSRKKWEVATTELARATRSRRKLKNSVSDSEYDRLKLLEQQSKLQIEQAEHDLEAEQLNVKLAEREVEIARHEVERRRILAPVSGVIVQVNRREGEWVQPGDTVLRIVRVDRLKAEGFLALDNVRSDLTGRAAALTVTTADGTRSFDGEVVFVSPEVNPVNGQVRFWAEFDNPELKLRPGLKGRLVIGAPKPPTTD